MFSIRGFLPPLGFGGANGGSDVRLTKKSQGYVWIGNNMVILFRPCQPSSIFYAKQIGELGVGGDGDIDLFKQSLCVLTIRSWRDFPSMMVQLGVQRLSGNR